MILLAPSAARPAALLYLRGFILDLDGDELLTETGSPVALHPQSLAVLRLLAGRAGRLVTKDELMTAVWPNVTVTEDSLTQCIADIRRALCDRDKRIVQTVPRRGYRLVAAPVGGSVAGSLGSIADGNAAPVLQAELPGRMPDRPAIAVLPFEAEGDGADADILATGIAGEVIDELARNRDIRILARQTSFAPRDGSASAQDIGRALRVRYLVQGSVRRRADTLSLDVRLVDVHDGAIAWSERFSAAAADIPRVRETIARTIAGTLHSGLRDAEKRLVLGRPPRDLDVYQLTLRGIALKHQFTPDATRAGRADFERAIAADPEYAPAWLYLAFMNATDVANQLTGEWTMSRIDEILAQFNRSISLDPSLATAYQGLSRTYALTGDTERSLRMARRAVDLGPSDADSLLFLANALMGTGAVAEALQTAEDAIALNPARPSYYLRFYAEILWADGQFARALEQADDCLLKAPRYSQCHIFRVLALVSSGRGEEAAAALRRFSELVPSYRAALQASAPHWPPLRERYFAGLAAAGFEQTGE